MAEQKKNNNQPREKKTHIRIKKTHTQKWEEKREKKHQTIMFLNVFPVGEFFSFWYVAV